LNPSYVDPAAIPAAASFVSGTLTGSLAAAVAIIAVGWFGLMVMAGRLSRRRGMQLILGCFIVFGAPLIASGIIQSLEGDESSPSVVPAQAPPLLQVPVAVQRPASSNPYDPYAGAALPPRR
jgi:type IV secretion system protein VirB2